MVRQFKARYAERREAYREAGLRGAVLPDQEAQSALLRSVRRERGEAVRFGAACGAVTALALLGIVGVVLFG